MLLSTQTEVLSRRFSCEDAINIIADAGFDAYDFTFYGQNKAAHLLDSETYGDYAHLLRDIADKKGIVCNQAHAPFPSSVGDEHTDAQIYKRIIRAMHFASILGAEIIVVHPKKHLPYSENQHKLFEMNMEFYKSLIPHCEKYNIKIACENMWGRMPDTNKKTHSVCSGADEFCKYIDTIGSKWLTACLDIGHIGLVGERIYDTIVKLGDRIQALHVHDTDGINDNHTLPFMSEINFKQMVKGLTDIKYSGDITFEADMFLKNVPDQLIPYAVKYMETTGRYLISLLEANKRNV